MSINIKEQIKNISDEIKESYGECYGEQWETVSMSVANKLNNDLNDFQILLEAVQNIVDEDYKFKFIQGLQKKIREHDVKINNLENKNIELKKEISELKSDMTELKNRLNEKERKEYIILLIQASRNMEHYIIKQITNWTDEEIRNYGGLNKFKKNNLQHVDLIKILEDEFGLTKNKSNIIKLNELRKIYSHPSPIDTDELEKACNTLCGKYNGLTELYNGYMKYCEYIAVPEDE